MTTTITAPAGAATEAPVVEGPKSPAELGQHIEDAFGNALQVVRLAASSSARGGLQQHELRKFAFDFRTQLHGTLEAAWYQLNVLLVFQRGHGKDSHCASERARARAIIYNIGDWLRRSYFPFPNERDPDGYDPLFTVRVPTHVLEWLRELDVLGRVLRMAVIEIGAQGTVGPLITLDEARLMLSRVSPPRAPSADWATVKQAAKAVGLKETTLRNRRLYGQKSEDGILGVDTDGRVWAKARKNIHTCYLRTFLHGRPSL